MRMARRDNNKGVDMIKQYRKKPVIIEAIEYNGNNDNEIENWSNDEVFGSPVLEPTKDKSNRLLSPNKNTRRCNDSNCRRLYHQRNSGRVLPM